MIEETLLEAEEKMDKAVEVAKEDFAAIRTGRANPGLYNKVLVDYYGSPTPLQQLASFAIPDARTTSSPRSTRPPCATSNARSAIPRSAPTRPTTATSSGSPSRN